MRTTQVSEFGGPDVLGAADAPDPVAGAGQVVIAVAVADVLFLDAQQRAGWGRDFFGLTPPYVPGSGVAGVVASVGAGADPAWIGRRVVSRTDGGGYAEKALARASDLVAVPDGLRFEEAAALLQTGPAALALIDAAAIRPGERVLVTAAAGGLGTLLVGMARAAGAQIVGTARGQRKLDAARSAGAHDAVDHSVAGWPARVRDATGGAGLDVVFDGVGGHVGRAAFALASSGGRFFGYGVPSGEFAAIDTELATDHGVDTAGIELVQFAPDVARNLAQRALSEAAAGRLRPVIGAVVPLDRAADAHAAIEARDVVGRTLLVTSQAVRYTRHGGPEVLSLDAVTVPEPGPGQVRIRVHASTVNPVDAKIRQGLFADAEPDRPQRTGLEVAGVVDTTGAGVATWQVGDPVFGQVPTGGAATHALADAGVLVAKPAGLTFEEAAALPVATETAHRTLRLLGVRAGHRVLIHAAAGSVGLVAAQLARVRGAEVVGTASEANHDFLRGLGILPIAYGDGLEERLRSVLPHGVDAVLDASGRGVLPLSISLTGDPSRVVTIADPNAADHGVHFSTSADSVPLPDVFADVLPLIEQGRLTLPIAAALPLEDIVEAHRQIENPHPRGKIVLTV